MWPCSLFCVRIIWMSFVVLFSLYARAIWTCFLFSAEHFQYFDRDIPETNNETFQIQRWTSKLHIYRRRRVNEIAEPVLLHTAQIELVWLRWETGLAKKLGIIIFPPHYRGDVKCLPRDIGSDNPEFIAHFQNEAKSSEQRQLDKRRQSSRQL